MGACGSPGMDGGAAAMTRLELIGTLSNAVEAAMNGLGAAMDLPPMHWSLRPDGEIGGFPHDGDLEDVALAARWAGLLRLNPPVDDRMGARCWRGKVDTYQVEVWAVVDPAAWAVAVGGARGVD